MTRHSKAVEVAYDPMAMLNQFHAAFEEKQFIDLDSYGRLKLLRTRLMLIDEEFHEVADELMDATEYNGNRSRLAKELADLLYVVYGTAALLEIPLYAVFVEVHRSNMSKLGADGKPVRREDGKILKGPHYSPADIDSVLLRDVQPLL